LRILSQTPYLRVTDIARSLAFYVGGLGFEVTDQSDDEHGPFWVRLEKDGVVLMLSNRPSRFLDFIEHEPGHFHEHDDDQQEHFHGIDSVHDGALNFVTYVYVEDVDAVHEELVGRGLRPLDAPADRFYGLREFLLRDPDGYHYAFAQIQSR
jgi:catechol 2,3-dioxygenase-like lactoylglutathione lyase family enzyme